jgi:superfamily I DNA/RNA helicase
VLKLTDEQAYAVELAATGNPLKIEAFAGTGKTSTLKAIAEALPNKRIMYLAFNKMIADEASKKFPGNVQCRTSHSLAYREVGGAYGRRIGQKLNGDALAQFLGIYEFHGIRPRMLCSLALETIRLYCQSSSKKLTKKNLPRAEMEIIGINSDAEVVGERILQIAQKTWAEMQNPDGSLPVTHDFYLKLWAMRSPKIHADIILLDEWQDANRLLVGIIENQESQSIYVGDRYQQIYSWRGAVNAMDSSDSINVARLTQSFRFGQEVADVANEVLTKVLGSDHTIKGNPARASVIAPVLAPNAILCRTNAECIRQVMRALTQNLKVKLQGGTSELKGIIKGIEELKAGRIPSAHSLALFTSFEQLKDFSKTELGRDLASTLKLVDEYTAEGLLDLIETIEGTRVDHADVIVSTGHKAKGLEWDSVCLGADFRGPSDKGYKDEDGNLLYVAATRAINELDITKLPMFDSAGKYIEPEPEEAEVEPVEKVEKPVKQRKKKKSEEVRLSRSN